MIVRLTPTQRRIVEHGDGALLVEAGPGSGKTRVLTERVRRLLAQPGEHFRLLALTFTNKAANEMIERLDDVPDIRKRAFIGTLHSFCMEVLANRGKPVGIDGLPNIFESFDDRKQILANAVRNDPQLVSLLRQQGDAKEQQKALSRWLERISEMKNSLQDSDDAENQDEQRLYEAYDAELRASAGVDYDDLLLLAYRLFEERPKIAEFYQRQYKYICIDEAQDLNEAQYRLLTSLCGATFKNVMAVGDPKQAIYVWNGADPKYLDMFVNDFDASRISLSENFRSSKAVVSAAQRLDASYSVEGQLPIVGEVSVIAANDESSEADEVVDKLKKLVSEGHPDVEGDITLERCAVLGRNRFVFSHLEEALKREAITYYKKLSAAAHQSESGIVKEFELALRLIANPRDRLHRDMLIKAWGTPAHDEVAMPTGAVGDPMALIQRLGCDAQQGSANAVLDALQAMKWSDSNFQLPKALDCLQQRVESFEEEERALAVNDIVEWRKHWDTFVRSESGGSHTVSSFLGQVALGTTQQPKESGLALLTVHSSKGMEFDVVFVMGMAEGIFPDYRAKGIALEEEQRSAFVAVTRSKRLLYLSYPRTRVMPWGAVRGQTASRYISQITG
jgi:DNA helicase-2/ATP-dependent DNA helicase PcrA